MQAPLPAAGMGPIALLRLSGALQTPRSLQLPAMARTLPNEPWQTGSPPKPSHRGGSESQGPVAARALVQRPVEQEEMTQADGSAQGFFFQP